jgi:hypothetical protein
MQVPLLLKQNLGITDESRNVRQAYMNGHERAGKYSDDKVLLLAACIIHLVLILFTYYLILLPLYSSFVRVLGVT